MENEKGAGAGLSACFAPGRIVGSAVRRRVMRDELRLSAPERCAAFCSVNGCAGCARSGVARRPLCGAAGVRGVPIAGWTLGGASCSTPTVSKRVHLALCLPQYWKRAFSGRTVPALRQGQPAAVHAWHVPTALARFERLRELDLARRGGIPKAGSSSREGDRALTGV